MIKKTALNAARMKSKNYRRILDEIWVAPASRSELARRIGLTRAAVSVIVDSLLQRNILVEGDVINTKTRGRSSTELHWNKDAFYSVGISLQRNKITVGLTDFCGNLLAVSEINLYTYAAEDKEALLIRVEDIIENFIKHLKPSGEFLGIGISSPGPFDLQTGTILNPPNFEFLHNTPIVEILKERFNCKVIIENDANACALVELRYGTKAKYDSFLLLDINEGVGSGLILNGKLNKGVMGHGNELGHVTIDMNGPKCQCGNYGCAELYSSIPNIVAQAKALDESLINWKTIVEFAYSGVPTALEILKREAEYIATMAVTAINILDIQAVVLTGQVAYNPELLISMIEEEINNRIFTRLSRTVKVLRSQISRNSQALLGSNLMIENYLEDLSNAVTFESES
ncbi:MAG: ROK family transcriptional regulator [Gracilibacteraceae bacterium]|jgi:predicted NBD/HSP70 family sugar kinase|nr:ROK family transcriptional regulator [Gracilibacteraceae bacterium]